MTNDDMDRVVPLGQLDDFQVAEGDPDVRGWEVLASDGRKIGEVDELLVDTSAMKVRYLDVDVDDGVTGDGMDRHVLIPIGYARLERERDCVRVDGIASADLRGLPAYDQGPLTRDFETTVRDSFSRGGAVTAGMSGAGMGTLDTAGLDNTPGMGTALGATGTTTGAGQFAAGTGMRGDDDTLGAGVPDGEGMRAAGYVDREPIPAERSPRTGLAAGAAGSDRGFDTPRTGAAMPETRSPRTGLDAGAAGTSRTDASGGAMSAGSQGPVSGMGTDREPRGDASHRDPGHAGSDYLHNADEDFYASDAFDEGRFYGARRGSQEGGGRTGR